MYPPPKPSSKSLFQVYLRLRPAPSSLVQLTQQSLYPLLTPPERYLTVEPPTQNDPDALPTHITIHAPNETRKRAVEKFAFTKVFEERAEQLEIFKGTGLVALIEGVLGEGRDGLLATLGVTGSGKSHTILGSKSQRGLTQLSLDVLYRSVNDQLLQPASHPSLVSSLSAADASEAHIQTASSFLDGVYGDVLSERSNSRAPTPMMVGRTSTLPTKYTPKNGLYSQWSILGLSTGYSPQGTGQSIRAVPIADKDEHPARGKSPFPSQLPFWNTPRLTRTQAKIRFGKIQDPTATPSVPRRNLPQRPSTLPQYPDISDINVNTDPNTEYAILVSMYEVYNDRIFDLLSSPPNPKDLRRRPLLFKSTETSPDRKVVAGLRKVVCGSYEEALMVLETGLIERRVAGTGSNSVSSRSHGFFCIEVKRRPRGGHQSEWSGAQISIVDLAGSERARNAKTAGATLAEAGKINESLMYLGQCLQMQSDCHDGTKPSIVPFRQCKLTELLFSNSFPSSSHNAALHHPHHHRNAQKAIMIVTADPLGDFNATSQILRYSALAREVTVPRIPSVSSTIFSSTTAAQRSQMASGRVTPNGASAEEYDAAISEVARLGEEVEILAVRLAEEEGRRREAEEEWQRAEERAEDVERQVREECWTEMEMKIDAERRRWMGAWSEEADRNDEHLDRKLDILTRGIQIHEDPTPGTDDRIVELESENESLRRKFDAMERELQCRSPTKTKNHSSGVLAVQSSDVENVGFKLNRLSLEQRTFAAAKTPKGKVQKLTARKWDLGDEEDVF